MARATADAADAVDAAAVAMVADAAVAVVAADAEFPVIRLPTSDGLLIMGELGPSEPGY